MLRFRVCSQGSQPPSEASGCETFLLLERFQEQNKAGLFGGSVRACGGREETKPEAEGEKGARGVKEEERNDFFMAVTLGSLQSLHGCVT